MNIYDNIIDYDSHKMVEAYMILCNHLASNHTFIKRINSIKKSNDNISNKYYNICLQNAAVYSFDDKIHESIGLKYTHFTSPLRRYVDFLNHIIIYDNINKQIKINKQEEIKKEKIDLDLINNVHRYYKKIYNLRNIHNLIKIYQQFGENQIITKSGQIIFIEDNNLKVLIDDIIINVTIFNKKIIDNNIIKILESSERHIIFTYKDKEIKFELFQNINITIYRNKMEINMFRFVIDDLAQDIFE
jgi:exoribonuclease R